jgi:cytoskeletal protein CcmA (bactofilin family)
MGLFGRGKHAPEEEEQPPRPLQAGAPPEVSFETVLGPGSTMKGELSAPGSVRLEGSFEGTLQLEGNALVGERARVIADIEAANVTVAGAVRGNVSGQRVQLLRTGRVWGDIQASSISTEEGAFIQGTITMRGGEVPSEFEEMAPGAAAALPELQEVEAVEALAVDEPFTPAEPLAEPLLVGEEASAEVDEPEGEDPEEEALDLSLD